MASSSALAQSKVTDYYRRARSHRSPSPKRLKQALEIPRTPAITRFICTPDITISLELPATYTLLLNWFISADQLVSIMYNRQELITFVKLQAGVQKSTRRNFGLKQLGQIKTVYPEAYEYEQLRTTRQAGILQNRRQEFELTIKPNLITDLSTYGLQTPIKSPRKRVDVTPTKTPLPRTPVKRPYFALSPTKTPSKPAPTTSSGSSPCCSPSKSVTVASSTKLFTGGRLIARNQVFRRNIFGVLRQLHKEFLGSLSPPIKLTEEEEQQLTVWHPKFLANEEALEIAPASLPEPPVVDKIVCAKDLISGSKPDLSSKLKAAIVAVSDAQSDSDKATAAGTSTCTSSKPAIKGVPSKLLEKIREKERQKKQLAMLRSPEEEAHRLRLSRLPDFVRIINMYFATEAKAVLPSAQVHKKLSDSYASPISTADIIDHLKLLRELAPDWISQTELGEKGSYLRINREYEMTEVLKILGKH